MYYIYTLDAHEWHGPFTSYDKAHAYAILRVFGSFSIHSDRTAQNSPMFNENLRLVPVEYR